MLVVRDDELDMGDDEVMLSEVAKVGERAGKTLGMQIRLAGPRKLLLFKLSLPYLYSTH